jgi:hypothetical protein
VKVINTYLPKEEKEPPKKESRKKEPPKKESRKKEPRKKEPPRNHEKSLI